MTRTIGRLGAALLAIALLLPVGDAPWYSFWREWTAAIAVLLIVLAAVSTLRARAEPVTVSIRSIPVLAIGLAALCWFQLASGRVPYLSDAALASLYLSAFGICALVAGSLPSVERDALADRLAACMAGAALASVPLAAFQWVGLLRLDMDMPVMGGRPVAHMEQANLLCSLLIQGLLGVWRLAERRRLGASAASALGVPILLTIVLTQSRVAWIVAIVVLLVVAWRRDLFGWRNGKRVVFAAISVVIVGTLLLPWLDTFLGLKGASLGERVSEGRRPAAWLLFIDAAMTHFWTGWGVLQNGATQFAMADRHPSLGYSFSSAHNFIIDLMVWFGVPIGLIAGASMVWALVRRIRRASSSATLVTTLGIAALLLHGLVELPLHYAYFLLPLGLMFGVTRCSDPGRDGAALRVPIQARTLLPALSLAVASMLGLLGSEYIRITNARPVLAVDKPTRHLMLIAELAPPDVVLLDQLRAYHAFAALPLARGATAAELEAARVAMQRTPLPTSIERYALLTGINGRQAEAQEALLRLCKFETVALCARSQRAWPVWRQQWPELPLWPTQATAH